MTNQSTNENESGLGAFIFLFILLMLQTGCFAVIIISKCDHAAIRIYTGFIGIGLAVFPVFVRRVLTKRNTDGDADTLGRVSKMSEWNRGAGFIVNLILTLATPWVMWFLKLTDRLTFTESVTPAAIMQISAGSLGFFIAGCIAFVRDFKTAGTGFNIFKGVLLGSLVVYSGYIAMPGLLHFGQWVSHAANLQTTFFAEMIGSDSFWTYTSYTIGTDAIEWMVGFIVCLYANIMAYRDGFLKQDA